MQLIYSSELLYESRNMVVIKNIKGVLVSILLTIYDIAYLKIFLLVILAKRLDKQYMLLYTQNNYKSC